MYKKLFIVVLSICMLSGCGSKEKKKVNKVIRDNVPITLSEEGHDVKEAINKSETITIKSNSNKINAQVSIPSINEGDMIKDTTVLKNISNKGDENITLTGHKLLVENNKNSITYEGSFSGDLPVGVDVSYYLDGVKVNNAEGKSGKLKIIFTYKNKTKVPFVAASILLLPIDTVSSINVNNGKSMAMDDYQAVIGIGCPGYKHFPDHTEITMDVKDFKPEYMSTVFSDGVFKDLDLTDLNKTTQQLNDSSRKLVEGSGQLLSGATTYGQYLDTYSQNVSKLTTGTKALLQGSKQYDASTQALIKQLVMSIKNENKMIMTIQSKVETISLNDEQRQAVNNAIHEGVHESIQESIEYVEQLSQLLNNSPVSKQLETLSNSLDQLSQAGNELSTQYQTLLRGIQSLSEGMCLFDSKGIQKITDLSELNQLKTNDHYSGLTGKNITSTKFIFEMN